MRHQRLLAIFAFLTVPHSVQAQVWNEAQTVALVERAIERRLEAKSDSGLNDYFCRAHGFVFFLGQLGDLSEPPRLVKSDQLELEVYWEAPGHTKQRIIGWRDRADLPTDIRYHRDHLGIVTNNFGDRIGIGEGDEIEDVPHPLSPVGPELYDYALVDSMSVRLASRSVRVYEVRARPKDFEASRVVGNLYIDVETADLVRFRFTFTRNAYIDDTLEDITVVLENGLWDGRYWLPRRQELEIRRHTSWLDLPARGIIRGWWEIDGYRFNTGMEDVSFSGPEIVAAPRAVRDTFRWEESLDAAVRSISSPGVTFDLEEVRSEVMRMAEDHVLSGFARAKPGAASVSELLHYNRVEGLAPGFGWVFRPGNGTVEVRLLGSFGIDDRRLKGRAVVSHRMGGLALSVEAGRTTRDIGDGLVIAPALNSLLAQEFARDYGDYYLATEGKVTASFDLGPRTSLALGVGIEDTETMATRGSPATGTFRDNPALGSGFGKFATLALRRGSAGFSYGRGMSGTLAIEGGLLEHSQYLRIVGKGESGFSIGPADFFARTWVGWGSEDLPPHRGFVIGGRGSLIGDPFRAWGGRHMAFGVLEWRVPVPFFAIPLGSQISGSTGNRIFLAPFVGAGWTGGDIVGGVGTGSDGIRPMVGAGIEWFHRLIRVDFGVGLRDRSFGLVVDVGRDLWPIL